MFSIFAALSCRSKPVAPLPGDKLLWCSAVLALGCFPARLVPCFAAPALGDAWRLPALVLSYYSGVKLGAPLRLDALACRRPWFLAIRSATPPLWRSDFLAPQQLSSPVPGAPW